MYLTSPQLYEMTADRLKESIGAQSYFSGSICFDFADVACRLVVSVIVYRSLVCLPEGDDRMISDLVPVWWEFHTVDADGEFINDFSFSNLRLLL